MSPEILKSFRDGESEALEAVYRNHISMVTKLIRFGFCVSGDPPGRFKGVTESQQLQDLVHDVFIKAFHKNARLSYDGLRPYAAFLTTITKNTVIDFLRKSGREILVEDSTLEHLADESAVLHANDPIEAVAESDLLHATAQFVKRLREPEASVYTLRFQKGFSQRDAAEQLDVTRRRVRTAEKSIREGLKHHLIQLGFIEELKAAA